MRTLCFIIFFFSVGAAAAPKNTLEDFFKDKTRIENPLELRDPFKSPQSRGQQRRQTGNPYRQGENTYSNVTQENLRAWNIYELRVVGVMIGKERRAIITRGQAAGNVVVVKEGMTIGPDNAEVKAILPGGIILVEKIINVYGQEEYLETVVPISR